MKKNGLSISFTVIMLCLSIVSCSQNPAQIKDYSKSYYGGKSGEKSPSKVTKTKRSLKVNKAIKVQKGDTLYDIATKFSVPSREIIEANKLSPPYFLKTGKKIKLPQARFYKVKKGDTIYSISRNYGVDMASITKINNMKKPYRIAEGQKVRLPYSSYKYEFKAKNTAIKVAKRNVQRSKHLIYNEKPAKKTRKKPSLVNDSRSYAATLKKPTRNSKRKITKLPPKAPSKFIWPAKGKLISKYGAKKGGIFNDGINISAPEGSKIKASAGGVVVYTGNGLKGYGNLLIIKHGGGWLTAYAHVKKIKVNKGDSVRRGQIIGAVGSTGNVDRPQLHFALRKGRKAVNPIKYISG